MSGGEKNTRPLNGIMSMNVVLKHLYLTYQILVWELVVPQVHVCDVSHPAEPRGHILALREHGLQHLLTLQVVVGQLQLIVLQLLWNTEGPKSLCLSLREGAFRRDSVRVQQHQTKVTALLCILNHSGNSRPLNG